MEQEKFIEALSFGSKRAHDVAVQIDRNATQEKDGLSAAGAKSSPLFSMPGIELGLREEKVVDEKILKTTDLNESFQRLAYAKIYEVLTDYKHDKLSRDLALNQIRNTTVKAILKEASTASAAAAAAAGSSSNTIGVDEHTYTSLSEHFYKYLRSVVRELALRESKRVDGRKLDEIRPLSCSVDLFNSLHGSALFQRGQTQVLCSVTFDSPDSMYRADALPQMISPSLSNFNKNFMLHYEFPAYATNEIARVGGRGDRREIGHGALAGLPPHSF